MLQLNNVKFPTRDFALRCSFSLESEDLGGFSSATDSSHQGVKPVMVRVSFLVPFSDAKVLSDIVKMAQAKDEDGDLVVYDITNKTANAFGMRKAIFDGEFACPEDNQRQVWPVSFLLKQKVSYAERVESRQQTETTEASGQGFEQVRAAVMSQLP
ncbi:hypothetical protein [Dasania marina]|uniref:baseplate complex protein n=1 Tax=Dasania marina TaxID=471499 RepID=UPI0003629A53|nr:hypothetical protein [Dasania marina]